MERSQSLAKISTLQEWSSFLNVLHSGASTSSLLVKKAESADRIVMHLEKQFSKVQEQPIFRRLGKHTQLVLRFS